MEEKKKGRRKKTENITENIIENNTENSAPPVHKKRGRKPKGGKIITTTNTNNNSEPHKQNIILHLKCSINEINNIYNINYIQSYNTNTVVPFNNDDTIPANTNYNYIKQSKSSNKEIWDKLKSLSATLHSNMIPNKKSNCFWCTCNFDGPPVFIPKHKLNNKYHVYGIFCSPECAAAFLFNENIDNSQKFERFYLLNDIYSSIYNYINTIKPAPSPLYLLDKFLGNFNVDEYRNICKNNQLISIIDKPISRIFPELFEDNDEYNIKNIPNNDDAPHNYKLCRKNTQNKNKYLSTNFCIN